jgi:hypothetical protein
MWVIMPQMTRRFTSQPCRSFEQVRLAEGVRMVLVNNRLALEVGNAVVNVGAAIAGDEEGGVGILRDVLDVDVMPAMLTEALQQGVGLLGGQERLDQFHFAAGEVVFLDVDEEQGCVHGESFLSGAAVFGRSQGLP